MFNKAGDSNNYVEQDQLGVLIKLTYPFEQCCFREPLHLDQFHRKSRIPNVFHKSHTRSSGPHSKYRFERNSERHTMNEPNIWTGNMTGDRKQL